MGMDETRKGMHQVRRRPRTDVTYKGQRSRTRRSKPGERGHRSESRKQFDGGDSTPLSEMHQGDRSDQDLETYIGSIQCVGVSLVASKKPVSVY